MGLLMSPLLPKGFLETPLKLVHLDFSLFLNAITPDRSYYINLSGVIGNSRIRFPVAL